MDRRAILRLFGGSAAVVASGVSVKEAAAQMGIPEATVVGRDMPDMPVAAIDDELGFSRYRLISPLHQVRERMSYGNPHMPAHIASKRSWSPVFKESVRDREVAIIDALIRKLEDDDAFAKRFAKIMGVL